MNRNLCLFNNWLHDGPLNIHPGVPPGVGVDTMMWMAIALTGSSRWDIYGRVGGVGGCRLTLSIQENQKAYEQFDLFCSCRDLCGRVG